MTQPPAAWYPDPDVPGQQRYWDGSGWTEHVHQPTVPTLPPAPSAPGMSNPGAAVAVTTDQVDATGQAIVAWILTVLTFGYFLPWAIAATRGKSNSLTIGLLNLLLGWTVIGWIVALVLACGAHQQVAIVRQ